jgi:ribose transport system substrate-binding protein
VDISRSAGRHRSAGAALAVLAAALTVAACGSSDDSSSSSTSTPSKAAANANKPVRIAYLSFAVANSYDAPMLAAAQTVAKGNNSTIKVFDANNDPKKQFAQLQTATSSGDYDAIIVQPIFGTGLITGVQILGKDMSTDQPQVDGLSGNVVFVPPPSSTPPKEPASTSHPRWPTPVRADADLRGCRSRRASRPMRAPRPAASSGVQAESRRLKNAR